MEINFKYEEDMCVSVYQTLSLMIAFGLLIVAVLKEQKNNRQAGYLGTVKRD